MKKLIILSSFALFSNFAFSQIQNNVFDDFAKIKKSQPVDSNYNTELKSETSDYLAQAPSDFDKNLSQYFIVVDSSFKKQNLLLAFWDAQTQSFQLSPTMTKVSTGRTGSIHHFITPTGWVEQVPENGTYRAMGTKNENGIRGYGVKGLRIWDFGWQHAYTGWLKKPELREIRMQMHATDPQFLEPRLGHPASAGCIRLSAETNRFLDSHSIIDRKIENSSQSWVLKKDRTPVDNEGSFVLVVNTDKPVKSIDAQNVEVNTQSVSSNTTLNHSQ